MNLAKEDEEFDAGAKTWWGQRAKFKGLGAQVHVCASVSKWLRFGMIPEFHFKRTLPLQTDTITQPA